VLFLDGDGAKPYFPAIYSEGNRRAVEGARRSVIVGVVNDGFQDERSAGDLINQSVGARAPD
jgi:hypothetical protein